MQSVCSHVVHILRREREKQKLSMNLVAERAGVSQQMVSYVEREMRNPTLETLLRIAAALKIDLAKVLRDAQKAASKSQVADVTQCELSTSPPDKTPDRRL